MKKKLILVVILFLLNNNISFSKDLDVSNYFNASKYLSLFPLENLGIKSEEVEYTSFYKKLNHYSKPYKLNISIDLGDPTQYKVVVRDISIFMDNKKIGYVILRPAFLEKNSYFMNILSNYKLDKKNYFNKRVRNYKHTDLEVHEKKHDGYIERVFISIRKNDIGWKDFNNVLGTTFYPEELDNEFKPEIIKSLNIFMFKISNEIKSSRKEISLEHFYKINNKLYGNPNEGYKQPKRDNKNKIIEEPENNESYLKELEPSEESLKNEAQYDSLED